MHTRERLAQSGDVLIRRDSDRDALRDEVRGISDRMLARTLADLERDGMVTRTVHSAIPPHVEYEASPLGLDVSVHLGALIHMVESRLPEVLEAQSHFDADQ